MDLTQQIEDLHGKILEKLDALNALRDTLRHDYVPGSVCTHLEQCVKETEVCIAYTLTHVIHVCSLHDFSAGPWNAHYMEIAHS